MSCCSEMIAPKDGSLNFSEPLKFGCIPLLQVGPHPPTPSPKMGEGVQDFKVPLPFLNAPWAIAWERDLG